MNGKNFKMIGTSDFPVCDCCGKTNLVRAVIVENDDGEEFNIGTICASKVLRQVYQGKRFPVSAAAVLSMAKAAKASASWKTMNGWTPSTLVAA